MDVWKEVTSKYSDMEGVFNEFKIWLGINPNPRSHGNYLWVFGANDC